MTWLNAIATHRAQTIGHGARARPIARKKIDFAEFKDAMVSEKVLARHGASLHPALADMNTIAQTTAAFEPFRAAQFGHALDRFYSAIARQLEKLDEKQRAKAATIAVSTMRAFIAEVGPAAELMPAMATLSSMLEPRGKLDVDPAKHAGASKRAMLEMLEAIEGRDGTASMLHLHRHVLEVLELATPGLTASDRPRIWKLAGDLVSEAMPRTGADYAKTGHLAAKLAEAIAAHPHDAAAAAEMTKQSIFAEQLAPREAARAKLAGAPEPMAKALAHVLDANPAGPPEIATAVEGLADRSKEHADPQVLADMAKVIDLVAESPAVRAVLDHLVWTFPMPVQANDADSVPYALIRAYCAERGGNAQELEEPLRAWARLPKSASLRASLALMNYLPQQNVAPSLAVHLGEMAASMPRMEDLTRFAERYSGTYQQLVNNGPLDDPGLIAAALARRPGEVDWNVASRVANMCKAVKSILKDLPLERTLDALLDVRDPAQFLHDPLGNLYDLLKAVGAAELQPDARAAMARAAIRTAAELGKLDRDPRQTDFPKILEDWKTALAEPEKLSFATGARKATSIRARKSILSLIDAHPKLPLEVAVTAAVHLSPEQLGWMMQQIESTRSHAEVRIVRDTVFAAVSLGRIDLIDSLRRSKSDHAAKLAAESLIAEHHRQQKLNELPVDRLIEGLGKGEDPAAAIIGERAGAALGALELGELDVDPESAKLLASVQKEVTDLLAFFPVGGKQHNVDTARFRDPLLVAIRETAIGRWPSSKFQGEVAERHLKDLPERAREIWAEEGISSARGVDVDQPQLIEAMQLVRGLAKAMPAKWDRGLLERMTAEKAEKIEALRGVKRGTEEHKRIASELAPLTRKIALAELKLGIERQLAAGAGASTALLELKPLIAAAIGPAHRLAGPGVAEALHRIADAAEPLRRPGREGLFAADESRIDAYLTSFGGSCVNPSNGFNRASLAELIAGSQYKMGRIMDGDRCVGRTIFRLIRIKLANGYEGYGLRMDKPVLPTNWGMSPPKDQMELMYRHGLHKAIAMGVPFMISEPDFIQEHAKAIGCEVLENAPVQLWIEKGHTAMHHNQGMNQTDYFIAWPEITVGQTKVPPANAEDMSVERNYNMMVLMPPK